MLHGTDITRFGWRQNRKSWDPVKDSKKTVSKQRACYTYETLLETQGPVDKEWECHISSSG